MATTVSLEFMHNVEVTAQGATLPNGDLSFLPCVISTRYVWQKPYAPQPCAMSLATDIDLLGDSNGITAAGRARGWSVR
jgi:hypothetical protein